VDLQDIVLLQGNTVDWKYIQKSLTALCELKEDDEATKRLVELRDRYITKKPRRRRRKGS
jgi:hypothetical protein